MISVGYLTEFIVTRALPDHEAYLVLIMSNGTPALLPKKYAIKQYTVGEASWAAIFTMDGIYTILSQKSPQYIRKILEYLINDELQASELAICRVAKADNSSQFKVAVRGTGDVYELYKRVKPLQETIAKYILGTVYFIKYVSNKEEYIKNALLPGPRESIRRVILREEINQADVYVESASAGIFLGKKGNNVSSACKLTGYAIQIIAA